MDQQRIRKSIDSTLETLGRLRDEIAPTLEAVVSAIAQRVRGGGKLLLCGNGGSAADSQHVATELVVRYLRDRPGIPALALTVDTSILTAASNDLGFERVFARQVEALGHPGDVLIAISTSGDSPNVLRAGEAAKEMGPPDRGPHRRLRGTTGGDGRPLSEGALRPHPRIQEAHLVMEHLLCEGIEEAVTGVTS